MHLAHTDWPMRFLRPVAVCLLLALGLAACRGPQTPLQVGAKAFAEQEILAHLIVRLLADAGTPATVAPCGDTFSCRSDLRQGEIDLMVEYTGTALAHSGLDPAAVADPLATVERLHAEHGLRWLVPLGFENAFVVTVPAPRAATLEVESIGDLAAIEGGVRVSTIGAYARRPGDGLYPLLRRYGLVLAEPPLLIEDPVARAQALFYERVDAAVFNTTDGVLSGPRLRVLSDPFGFFPDYSAGIVVREAALKRHETLETTLRRLDHRIGVRAMRAMNARVQLEGREPKRVAAAFLATAGLVPEAVADLGPEGRELRVVKAADERLAEASASAMQAVRLAFPRRVALLDSVIDPVDDLVEGDARLALLGAERFFTGGGERPVLRDGRLTAVAVVGTRALHVVRRSDDGRTPFSGRLGLPPTRSAGAHVIETLLARLVQGGAAQVAERGSPRYLMGRVARETLDGAVFLEEAPAPDVSEALAQFEGLSLRAISVNGAPPFPFLRAGRIAAGVYPDVESRIDTLTVQTVLAAPAAQPGERGFTGGPGGALRTRGAPLTLEEAEALLAASPAPELPDPVLPSPWSIGTGVEEERAVPPVESAVDTALNVAAWAFLVLLVLLLRRRIKPGL